MAQRAHRSGPSPGAANHSQARDPIRAPGETIADRYLVEAQLGRGGMAVVYRVRDASTQRVLALKQLLVPETTEQRALYAALFEREFHTLAELSHPSVIEVYDYGAPPDAGPYYTMELLDGGDLRERAPVPWAELCRSMFDVCSSLALLHSRRLLHRDISPRNIRCTANDGAKLIDFGAMSAMSAGGGALAGTPAFSAPEAVQRSAVDARTDLFSLGATMYYALTGRLAYSARTFAEVIAAWQIKPEPPSHLVPEVPAALDDLVMSLLHVAPGLRPQSAFEVMQRLAAIAQLPRSEPEGVSRAYLATPTLVGRDYVLERLRDALAKTARRRGSALFLRASAGLGRSRMLDQCALEAETRGMIALRARPNGAHEPWSVAHDLVQMLLETLPAAGLREHVAKLCGGEIGESELVARGLEGLRALTREPALLTRRVRELFANASRAQPLLIAVDDAHAIDEPSAALLSELIERAPRKRMAIIMTALAEAGESRALAALTRRSKTLELTPLDRDETRALLASMFGDVANLTLLARESFDVARGNPRQIVDIAQHLLNKQLISYAAGVWTLPSTLSATDMPRSAEAASAERIALLSPLARALGEAHALAFSDTLTRDDYYQLCPTASPPQVEDAIMELQRLDALSGDGRTFTLSSGVWAAAFRAGASPEHARERHAALAECFRSKLPFALIHHLFEAGREEEALDALIARHERMAQAPVDLGDIIRMRGSQLGPTYVHALQVAERLQRPLRSRQEIRHWMVALCILAGPECYYAGAAVWLEQLKLDSGWLDWQADPDHGDAGQRLMRALQAAQARQQQLPEHERVYRVDEAIRFLTEFVAVSIAISARVHDFALMRSLPALLEPFAPLSRIVHSLWQNALATCDSGSGRYMRAHARWLDVHASLADASPTELQHATAIRNAVAFGIGLFEAFLGMPAAEHWVSLLEQDELQMLSALSLRKIIRLGQGDWQEADRIQRDIEVRALQARAPQMFNALLSIELNAYTVARDMSGLRDSIAQLRSLAEKYPGWRADLDCAEGRFELLRGDAAAAEQAFQRCFDDIGDPADGTPRNMPAWLAAQAGMTEVLLTMERYGEAYERARAAHATARAFEAENDDLTRMLALAEAKSGDFAGAAARLDEQIAHQRTLAVTGLRIGLSYEARAQIAIWAGDEEAFATYAVHTAREYRHGAGSPLGARYERLINEARRRGIQHSVALGMLGGAGTIDPAQSTQVVTQAFSGVRTAAELARRALSLICSARGASRGHLYLVDGERLTLVASQGEVEASDTLLQQARDYCAAEAYESELETMVEDALPVSIGTSTRLASAEYQWLLLRRAAADAEPVAVVALADEGSHLPSSHHRHLLEAIAIKLRSAYASGSTFELRTTTKPTNE
jgi:hypothetical protein